MDFLTIDRDNSNLTPYKNGQSINGLITKSWIERYKEPGEFSFTCLPTNTLRTQLALGTFVTHVDTLDVMFVENIQIDESKDSPPVMTVSGRSLDAMMDYRIADPNNDSWGTLRDTPVAPGSFDVTIDGYNVGDYPAYNYTFLTTAYTWEQLYSLLYDNLIPWASGWSANMRPVNIQMVNGVTGITETKTEKDARRTKLTDAANDFLDIFDGGIQVKRPVSGTMLDFVIHVGVDRSATVQFSWDGGEIDKATYLWSTKNYYNGALVRGKYHGTHIYPSGKGQWDIRMLQVDAEDIDRHYSGLTTAQQTLITNRLTQRGNAAIKKTKQILMMDAVVTPNSGKRYRADYNIGDIVYVIGNYDIAQKMRVTEYAEIEDENGEVGYPTLSMLS